MQALDKLCTAYVCELEWLHKALINLVVTLFELMVVNNWWIIMEGFQLAVENEASRAFFICFHLSTVVSYCIVMVCVSYAGIVTMHV